MHLQRGLVVLVFSILCIIVTTSLECPGEPPSSIKFLHGEGKAALQFEFDNPAIIQQGDYPPVIMLWGVFDLVRGYMRLDVPNPSILISPPSSLEDVIYLSLIFRFPQNSLYVVNYSNKTCTSHSIIAKKRFEFGANFFDKFTYRGTESINTIPVRKWSASIPLMGDFVYFEKCGQVPLQLQYSSTPELTDKLEEILFTLRDIISNSTKGASYRDLLLTPEKFAEAKFESHQKGIEKLAKMMDSVYSSENFPFSTWNAADSKFFERVTSNLPVIDENAEEIIVPSSTKAKNLIVNEEAKKTQVVTSNEKPLTKESHRTARSLIDKNSEFNYFVSRLAILNWVGGPVDQLSFVPHGKCIEGDRLEFPHPNITHPNITHPNITRPTPNKSDH